MGDPRDSDTLPASDTDPLTESLEELSEPLESQSGARRLPGATVGAEDEEPIVIVRLIRDGFPLRLYEEGRTGTKRRSGSGKEQGERVALNERRESPARSSLPDVSPGPGKLQP